MQQPPCLSVGSREFLTTEFLSVRGTTENYFHLSHCSVVALRSLESLPLISANQHTISVTVKAVAGFNSMLISRENTFAPRKRADQRQQRGPRQMKIR